MLIYDSSFHGLIKKFINTNLINVDITSKLDYTIASSYLSLDVRNDIDIVSNSFPLKESKNELNESVIKKLFILDH